VVRESTPKRAKGQRNSGTFEAPIGGGKYGSFHADDAPLFERRPDLLEVVAVLQRHGPMGMKKLADHLRQRGHSVGRRSSFRAELKEWADVADGPLIARGRAGYGVRSRGEPPPVPFRSIPRGDPAVGALRSLAPLGRGTHGDRSKSGPPPADLSQAGESELVELAKRELDATEIDPSGGDRDMAGKPRTRLAYAIIGGALGSLLGHHSAAYTLATYVHLMDDAAGDADFLDAVVADAFKRAARDDREAVG